jgi:hypothetical protein
VLATGRSGYHQHQEQEAAFHDALICVPAEPPQGGTPSVGLRGLARLRNTMCSGLEEVGLPVFSAFSALQCQLILIGKLLETIHLPQTTQARVARSWEN